MKGKQIIIGQKVNRIKQERAKQLRRVMTPEEKTLWYYLRSNQLNGLHFRRQQVIDGFIADFYCHAVGVVIEIDGGIHKQQKEYDVERDRIISSRGLQVIRIRNEEIRKDMYQVMFVGKVEYVHADGELINNKGDIDFSAIKFL